MRNQVSVFLSLCASLHFVFTAQAQHLTPEQAFYFAQNIVFEQQKSPVLAQAPTSLERHLDLRGVSEIKISDDEAPESEVHAVINPLDSANIIVAAMRVTGTAGIDLNLSFPIFFTKDFGQSWQQSSFNGQIPGFEIQGGGDPMLVFDHEGRAYFFWLGVDYLDNLDGKTALLWATSEDGGETWEVQPEPVAEGIYTNILLPLFGELVDKEWAAADLSPDSEFMGNIYLSYAHIALNFPSASYQIRLKRKQAGETSFSISFATVSTSDFTIVQYASTDVDRLGRVHVLFFGQKQNEATFALYHSQSADGGLTFSLPVKISEVHLPCYPPNPLAPPPCNLTGIDPNRVYPCCHLRADKSGGQYDGNLYVTWSSDGITSEDTPGLDVRFSKSGDGGTTWSTPIIVNEDSPTNPATHNFFPSMAVNSTGKVVLTWYDRREDTANILTKYYMTNSDDGGTGFSPSQAVSITATDFNVVGSKNGGFGIGEYTQVVATSCYAIPFWADGRTNDGNLDIYAAFIPQPSCCEPSGLMDFGSFSAGFSIDALSPNPATDFLEIHLTLQKPSALRLEIVDIAGKKWQEALFSQTEAGVHSLKIGLGDLAAGAYFLVAYSESGMRGKGFWVKR